MTTESKLKNEVLPALSLILLFIITVITVTIAVKKNQVFKITLRLKNCWRKLKVKEKRIFHSNITSGLERITSDRPEEDKLQDKIAFLETTNLQNDLSETEKENLAKVLTPIKFNEGETVMLCGNDAEVMYFIAEGSVRIFTFRGFEICELKKGSYFGTMPFVKELRDYNLTAITSCVTKLLALSKSNFITLAAKSRNFYNSMVEVADQRYKLLSIINGELNVCY